MRLFDQNIWGNFNIAIHCIGNRNQLLADLIFSLQPDICCFQECNPTSSRAGENAIQQLLKPGYLEACPHAAERNFTPVFYNAATLSLLEGGYLPFPGRNDLQSKSAAWAVLESRETGKRFAVISTHFWWEYKEEADNLQRVENAKVIGQICRDIQALHHVPVLVTGDLNCGPHLPGEALKEMERQGLKNVRAMAQETADTHTWHPYPPQDENGLYHPGVLPSETLDYMYAYQCDAVHFRRFQVLTDDISLTVSDHCPLLLDFDL